MRSIGRAGWASHGFFGATAQTFGNPDGASSGGGAWTGVTNQGGDGAAAGLGAQQRDGGLNPNGPNQGGGPTPPPPGPSFTFRGVPSGNPIIALVNDGAGNTLFVDVEGKVFESTNGGHTWGQVGTIAGLLTSATSHVMLFNDGVVILAADVHGTIADLYRSTDFGAVWSLVTAPITTSSGAGAVALGVDPGSNNWVAASINQSATPSSTVYAQSTNNGASWTGTGNVTDINGITAQFPILWDGARWVLSSFDDSFNPLVWISPDAGSWTQETTTNGMEFDTILFEAGTYFAVAPPNLTVSAPSVASMVVTGPDVIGPLATNTGFIQLMKIASGWIAVNQQGGGTSLAASSPDFATWTAVTTNMQSGESILQGCYDSVNNSVIIGGDAGSICTLP